MAREIPADLAAALVAAHGRVPVRKLPDGRAEGAGDLHAWASNRKAGRFGVTRRPLVLIRCKSCHYEVEMDIDPRRVALKCRRCGSRNIRADRRSGDRAVRAVYHDPFSRRADRAMQRWSRRSAMGGAR
jgi:hypothetical protein